MISVLLVDNTGVTSTKSVKFSAVISVKNDSLTNSIPVLSDLTFTKYPAAFV